MGFGMGFGMGVAMGFAIAHTPYKKRKKSDVYRDI